MGIRGLNGFIKWKLPCARKTLRWSEHRGETWGVDCSCLLYRARGSNLCVITVIASLLVRMRNAGIRAVFVFDGRTPAAKSDVVDQRREARQIIQKEMLTLQVELEAEGLDMSDRVELERRHASLQKKAPTVTSGDKNELKQFLYACGVQFVTAAGEADDVLAYLCRVGTLQGVISTDMDMLARGVPLMVIPETIDNTVLTVLRLQEVLSGIGLTYSQFVDACMLMGSDYSGKGWHGIEPKYAIERARKGVDWGAVDANKSICMAMEEGVILLSGYGVRWDSIVSEKQRTKWDMGPPPCEPENVASAAKTHGLPIGWIKMLGNP